ncbi:MAG: hypothetical protein EA359_18740 [Balneolaceae bacterium]|nr:MAG: hypothetical protein EA359_18740 [Balneolaceae bacterium]
MEKVTGIGGFIFLANNPKKLAEWYEIHFGITRVPESCEEGSWWQDEGPTVFSPFDIKQRISCEVERQPDNQFQGLRIKTELIVELCGHADL